MEIDLSAGRDAVNTADGGPIALPLLQLISEARNEHGMRQQQYTRYRHFCAKKAHRIREILQLTHSDGSQKAAAAKLKKQKGAKGKKSKKAQAAADQSAATKGHGNTFTPKTLSLSDVRDERPAQLLLFEAERAWAYSQDLRTQAFDSDNDPALRKRGLSRLRRAVQWSASLNDLVTALDARFDVYARCEAAAYAVMLRGASAFDHGQWQKALETLSVARLLLNAIAENSSSSRSEALANSFVDAGEAQMRYCAYQLGESEQNMDAVARKFAAPEVCSRVHPGFDALVGELKAKGGDGAATRAEPLSLSWHGRQIPVRNPELLDAITRAQAEESALHDAIRSGSLQDEGKAAANTKRAASDKVDGKRPRLSHAQRKAKKREAAGGSGSGDTAGPSGSSNNAATSRVGRGGRTELDPFDRALAALTDAEEVARRLVEDNTEALSKSHSARYETASKDLQTAHDWVFYRLLALRIARNARLVADVERKSERREKRAWANVEARLSSTSSPASKAPRSSGRSRSAKSKQARAAADRANKPAKKNQPGARAKAKRTWYRSELLRHLARAFSLSNAKPQALLLLTRAQLYVRQARQAAELADDVNDEDRDFPPVILELHDGKSAFDESDRVLEALKRQIQKEMFLLSRSGKGRGRGSGSGSKKQGQMASTKAGQSLLDTASKYVDFDPIDLEEAKRIPQDVVDECERELSDNRHEVEDEAEAEEAGDVSVAYDPGNALAEEEEARLAAEAASKKKGWLGGWFGRG
ncbi:uncharacterized protein PFL1_02389 [Pseudozyma flocculosa PF-1]|uniref:uncharacterized protein n=1 Tax=Pseudozyma flocculosa PF-1 TaxID=1277687 RepID=UPI00045614FC|nr:uncharacterized protein PFL1_02389 [Pseudozyma flocculosa PF-1]EPQ30273.1 hypothetical protein PFL1_02389 [Pseudozyma flocculosa PF-1]